MTEYTPPDKPAPLFAWADSQAAKADGIASAETNRETSLQRARRIARQLAEAAPNREITADDVGRRLQELNLPQLGPEAGALFKGGDWTFTGKRVRSTRVSNHAREIKVWRLAR